MTGLPIRRLRPGIGSCLALLLILACGRPTGSAPPTPVADSTTGAGARLVIHGHVIGAEVVARPEERAVGLMFRESLAPDSGMLFVFDSTQVLAFWMKNTLIPLDIAFADSSGVIVDIQHMAPGDTTTGHVSATPARYALETNLGWFQGAGVRPGDTILGLPRPTAGTRP